MKTHIDVPQAFSVRQRNEFYPIQHLMARLNPNLVVDEVAHGVHVDGVASVFWGLVYHEGKLPGRKEVAAALEEAGYDFARNPPI